jgi:hypothetical protein
MKMFCIKERNNLPRSINNNKSNDGALIVKLARRDSISLVSVSTALGCSASFDVH